MDDKPLIALISAVRASIPPTLDAFAVGFPEAQPWNIVDDRLLEDANAQGGLTPRLQLRMERLIDHALVEGASAVLLTCSLYAPVAHEAAVDADVPVLAPDDAVFLAIIDKGYHNVLLVSSGAGPLEDSVTRLRAFVGPEVTVLGALAEDAALAARRGDIGAVVDAIASAVRASPEGFEAVVLGQFSLAPAAEALAARLRLPVLAGPQFAVKRLHALISKDKP